MNLLLTNDDGWKAPGLAALIAALRGGHRLTVVAPSGNRSGVGTSITIGRPLAMEEQEVGGERILSLDGTPADCCSYALQHCCPEIPDLVLSGINGGLNPGLFACYSGTFSACLPAVFRGIPAVALSAAEIGTLEPDRLREYLAARMPFWRADFRSNTVWSVNIPDGTAWQFRRGRLCDYGGGRLFRKEPGQAVPHIFDPEYRLRGPEHDMTLICAGFISEVRVRLYETAED